MDRNLRAVLAVLAGIVLLGMCAGAMLLATVLQSARAFERVVEVGTVSAERRLVDYDAPAGYVEQFSAETLGFRMISLYSARSRGHIYLMQFPRDGALDRAEALRRLEQMADGQLSPDDALMRDADRWQVEVRDQLVTLDVREGASSDERPYRQITGVFEGRNGPVMLVIAGPQQEWDRERLQDFLDTIE